MSGGTFLRGTPLAFPQDIIVALYPVGSMPGYWQGVDDDATFASSPHRTIADVVRQVSTFEFPAGATVHLGVGDGVVHPGADHKLCGRPVWLGRMPDIGTFDCALPEGHEDMCLASCADVRRQLDRAAQRRAARRAPRDTKWRD